MTNRERYKRAFSALQASGTIEWEESKMKEQQKKQTIRRTAAAVAAFLIVTVGFGSAAYAANIGGIQRRIQIWTQGDQTNATFEYTDDGSYSLSYENEDGETVKSEGGGVAYDFFGRERPLTEDELIEELDSPEVMQEDDGRFMVYYHNQSYDITDKFVDGYCFLTVTDGDKTIYMTIKDDGSYATDFDKYPDKFE